MRQYLKRMYIMMGESRVNQILQNINTHAHRKAMEDGILDENKRLTELGILWIMGEVEIGLSDDEGR